MGREECSSFLDFIDCDKKCSLKDLTLKLTMLLTLSSATRAFEICFLDINYLVRPSSGYVCQFSRNTKTSKQGKPRNPIRFQHFQQNRNLCVCLDTDIYIDKTKDFCQEES